MAQPPYPYPSAEHCEVPHNPLDVIDDELRIYPDPRSFRQGVITIGRIYEKTPFLLCAKKYATLMHVATHAVENSVTLGLDKNFYAGEVFAVHTLLKPLRRYTRQFVLSQDALEEYGNGIAQVPADDEILKESIKELAEYRGGTWRELFDRQYPQLQEKLVDATVRLYGDIPNAGEAEDSFTAGYLFTGNLVMQSIGSPEDQS